MLTQDPALALEPLAVLVRDAEQFADDQGRDRQRELLHEVDRAALGQHRVDVRLDLVRDVLAQRPHALDGELGREQPAQAGVALAVEVDDRTGHGIGGHVAVHDHVVGHGAARAQPGVVEQGAYLVVAAEQVRVDAGWAGHLVQFVRGAEIGVVGRRIEGTTVWSGGRKHARDARCVGHEPSPVVDSIYLYGKLWQWMPR